MEQEEAGEREEKEKNEFSCWPSGAAIDRAQAGAERCSEPHSPPLPHNYWKKPCAAAALKLVIDLLSG